jgi:uncharacterized membrane protein
MNADETHEMAVRCMETIDAMANMMGAHGQSGMMPMGSGAMMPMAGAGVWLIGVLLLLLLGAVLLGTWIGRRQARRARARAEAAVIELDLRYVRGEVDRDNYLQIRQDLEQVR